MLLYGSLAVCAILAALLVVIGLATLVPRQFNDPMDGITGFAIGMARMRMKGWPFTLLRKPHR